MVTLVFANPVSLASLKTYFCLLQEPELRKILEPTVVPVNDVNPCQGVVQKHSDTGWAAQRLAYLTSDGAPNILYNFGGKCRHGSPLPGLGRDTHKSIPEYKYRDTCAGSLKYRY